MKKTLSLLLSISMVLSVLFSLPFSVKAVDIPTAPENGIPLFVINVDESEEAIATAMADDSKHTYGTIEDMNGSEDHSVRCVGNVNVTVPDGFVSEYGSSFAPVGNIKMKYMRGRGNTTWMSDKKPYKIEFSSPVDFFGMGESTDWALMANSNDNIQIRNRITSRLGESISLPYCPQSVPVDVVMKGSNGTEAYLGSYNLSETVKLEENRVNLQKLKKNTIDENAITGGYLLSLYTTFQNSDEPESNFFKTDSGLEFITKTPEYTSEDLTDGQRAQRAYIQKYVRDLDDLIMNSEEIDAETHNAIAEMLDLRSVADYWWVQEFSENGDAFGTSSTYFYKDRGGKLCFGPLWDFDLAWRLFTDDEGALLKGFNHTEMAWVDKLREKDPQFAELLKERWNNPVDGVKVQLAELTKAGGWLDSYSAEIKASWEKDRTIWSERSEEQDGFSNRSLEYFVETLREGINGRSDWIDSNLDSINKVFHTLTYIVDGNVYETQRVRDRSHLYNPVKAPEKDGYILKGWFEEETGESLDKIAFERDTVVVAEYVKESEETAPAALYFESEEAWCEIHEDDIFSVYMKVVPDTAIIGDVTWTSSDESVAEYSEEDDVFTINGVGDATITATLRNGVTNSVLLHVYDKNVTPKAEVSDVRIDAPQKLEPGAYAQIKTTLLPEGQPLNTLGALYDTDDPDIIDLDMSIGVIKALKPGKATVNIIVRSSWDENAPKIIKAVEITVDHTMDGGSITTQPTCTTEGVKSFKCTVCGQVLKTETVPVLTKKENTLQAKGKTVKINQSKLKRKNRKVAAGKAYTIKNAQGTVSYKLISAKKGKKSFKKKFKINPKTGKIAIKKGLKKGTYKVKVRVAASGSDEYLPAQKTVTVKVKVK